MHVTRVQADGIQESHRLEATVARLVQRVDGERFGEDRGHRLARIERRVRILEDHLDLAPVRHPFAARQSHELFALELHAARRGRVQADDRARARRLAATRLADEAERLPTLQLERHAVDGFQRLGRFAHEVLLADGEVLLEVGDLQERGAHDAPPTVSTSKHEARRAESELRFSSTGLSWVQRSWR